MAVRTKGASLWELAFAPIRLPLGRFPAKLRRAIPTAPKQQARATAARGMKMPLADAAFVFATIVPSGSAGSPKCSEILRLTVKPIHPISEFPMSPCRAAQALVIEGTCLERINEVHKTEWDLEARRVLYTCRRRRHNEKTNRKAGGSIAGPRCPGSFPRQRDARFVWICRRTQGQSVLYHQPHQQGSGQVEVIQIIAELGSPTVYPAPGSSVTTTLYA